MLLLVFSKMQDLDPFMKNHKNTGFGREGVRPLKEFVVDEISTKLHLPFFEGKSCLIFQFHLPHNSLMGPHRDFRDDSS